jgi:hypothetical protein
MIILGAHQAQILCSEREKKRLSPHAQRWTSGDCFMKTDKLGKRESTVKWTAAMAPRHMGKGEIRYSGPRSGFMVASVEGAKQHA